MAEFETRDNFTKPSEAIKDSLAENNLGAANLEQIQNLNNTGLDKNTSPLPQIEIFVPGGGPSASGSPALDGGPASPVSPPEDNALSLTKASMTAPETGDNQSKPTEVVNSKMTESSLRAMNLEQVQNPSNTGTDKNTSPLPKIEIFVPGGGPSASGSPPLDGGPASPVSPPEDTARPVTTSGLRNN